MSNIAATANFRELLKSHKDYLDRCRTGGARVLAFRTPCCGVTMETVVPKNGETWDSLTTCPYCGDLFMKISRREKVVALMPPDQAKP